MPTVVPRSARKTDVQETAVVTATKMVENINKSFGTIFLLLSEICRCTQIIFTSTLALKQQEWDDNGVIQVYLEQYRTARKHIEVMVNNIGEMVEMLDSLARLYKFAPRINNPHHVKLWQFLKINVWKSLDTQVKKLPEVIVYNDEHFATSLIVIDNARRVTNNIYRTANDAATTKLKIKNKSGAGTIDNVISSF